MCRRFGTLFHLHRWCEQEEMVHATYVDGIDSSETSAHKIQRPGNYPKEIIERK
jgi:hypothetical protein